MWQLLKMIYPILAPFWCVWRTLFLSFKLSDFVYHFLEIQGLFILEDTRELHKSQEKWGAGAERDLMIFSEVFLTCFCCLVNPYFFTVQLLHIVSGNLCPSSLCRRKKEREQNKFRQTTAGILKFKKSGGKWVKGVQLHKDKENCWKNLQAQMKEML